MPLLEHRDVQHTGEWNLRVFLRELNSRLRDHAQAVTMNRRESFSQVNFTTAANVTQPVWVANEAFELLSINVVGTTTAGTVTPRIGGVNVGGAPFNVTTTPVNHSIPSANEVAELGVVDMVTAGLTGTMGVSLNLRRVN